MSLAKYKHKLVGIFTAIFMVSALIFGMGGLAQAQADYNCGTYGNGAYQNNCSTASSSSGDSSGAGLANTGQSIGLMLMAALLILAGTVWLYKVRKNAKHRSDYNATK